MFKTNNDFTPKIIEFKFDVQNPVECQPSYVCYTKYLAKQEQHAKQLQSHIRKEKRQARKAMLNAYRTQYDVVWVIKNTPLFHNKTGVEHIDEDLGPFLSKKECEKYVKNTGNIGHWKTICVPRCPTEISDCHLLGLQKCTSNKRKTW